jgi:hypothetical protein
MFFVFNTHYPPSSLVVVVIRGFCLKKRENINVYAGFNHRQASGVIGGDSRSVQAIENIWHTNGMIFAVFLWRVWW